jgi:hypothetical protein
MKTKALSRASKACRQCYEIHCLFLQAAGYDKLAYLESRNRASLQVLDFLDEYYRHQEKERDKHAPSRAFIERLELACVNCGYQEPKISKMIAEWKPM